MAANIMNASMSNNHTSSSLLLKLAIAHAKLYNASRTFLLKAHLGLVLDPNDMGTTQLAFAGGDAIHDATGKVMGEGEKKQEVNSNNKEAVMKHPFFKDDQVQGGGGIHSRIGGMSGNPTGVGGVCIVM